MNDCLTTKANDPLLISEFISAASPVIMLWGMANNARILEVSNNIKIFGYSPSDFNNHSKYSSDLIHPADYPLFIDELKEAQTFKQSYISQTFRIFDSHKHIHWVNCLTIFSDNNNSLSCNMKSIFVDITEQKLAERHYKIQELDYQRVIANAGSNYFFYIHDTEGIFTYLSPSIQDMLGYSNHEFLNHYDTFLSDHPINSNISFRTDQSLLGIRQEPYQIEVYHKNGNPIRLEITEVPSYDDHGVVTSIIGMAHDITELIQQQRLLEQNQEQLKAILNGLSDSVIIVNSMHEIQYINKAAEVLFEYSKEEAQKLLITQLIDYPKINGKLIEIPSDLQEIAENMKRLSQKNSPIEALANSKNKSSATIRVNVSVLPGSQNEYILSCSDITQEKSNELQLKRAEKMDALGKMTGGICHDFNNILGVISGYASLLESLEINDNKCEDYISQIRKASERGARLSRKLLSFSGKNVNECKSVSINEILKQEKQILSRTLTPLINIDMNLEEDIWPVFINKGDLEDSILNICLNARHAMPEGGTLEISTQNTTLEEEEAFTLDVETGNYVVLSIKDSGEGMNKETLGKVFDPFFSTKKDGTGLGLSQTYNFIRGTDGGITVISEEGKGSEFLLYLPKSTQGEISCSSINNTILLKDTSINSQFFLSQEKGQPGKNHKESPQEKHPSQKHLNHNKKSTHILVVDDEVALKDITVMQLSKFGYTVYGAENGKEALEILKQKPIDLLLTDIIMPEMDGWELALEVSNKYPDVIIQLVTAYTEGSRNNQSELNNFLSDTLLHKPLPKEVLIGRIQNLIYLRHISQKKSDYEIHD